MVLILRSAVFPVLFLSLMTAGDMPDGAPRTDVRIPRPLPAVFQEGEELTYEVSWTLFRIGTVRIRTLPGYRARAWIDSYENIPVVDLHSTYGTTMDSMLFSRESWASERTETGWRGTNYTWEPTGSRVFVEDVTYEDPESPPSGRHMRDTLRLASSRFIDGLSIAYLPRVLAHTTQEAVIQTILNGRLGATTFYFGEERTEEEIDACDHPVKVIQVQGHTNVVGVFGMTGEFTGWFSDDEAAVPIKGKLNVLLGNISIELTGWNRPGWSPPCVAE
jgi:hypothetical protein